MAKRNYKLFGQLVHDMVVNQGFPILESLKEAEEYMNGCPVFTQEQLEEAQRQFEILNDVGAARKYYTWENPAKPKFRYAYGGVDFGKEIIEEIRKYKWRDI